MTDCNPAYSLIPPQTPDVQAPPVPRIDGVAPARFIPTRCDAATMTNIGLLGQGASTASGINPSGAAPGQPNVSMDSGNSLLNSAISGATRGGTGTQGGITINRGTTGTGGGCAAANAVANLITKAGSAGLSAAGGITGLLGKVGNLLGLGSTPVPTPVDQTGCLAQSINGGCIGGSGPGVVNLDCAGNLVNSVDQTGCLAQAFNGSCIGNTAFNNAGCLAQDFNGACIGNGFTCVAGTSFNNFACFATDFNCIGMGLNAGCLAGFSGAFGCVAGDLGALGALGSTLGEFACAVDFFAFA